MATLTSKSLISLGSGLAGAVALNLAHEGLRRAWPNAPRMDKLGMQALSHFMQSTGKSKPSKGTLYGLTLAGDVIANTLFYSLTGAKKPKNAWLKGSLLGTVAGLGATLLPEKMGLSDEPANRTKKTSAMTIGLYVLGGIAAAGALTLLERKFRS